MKKKKWAVTWGEFPVIGINRVKELKEKGILEAGEIDGDNHMVHLVAKKPLLSEDWQPILDFVLRGVPYNFV